MRMVECMAIGKSLKELYPNYITKVLSLSSRDEEMEHH
jgi:hypothetical protein